MSTKSEHLAVDDKETWEAPGVEVKSIAETYNAPSAGAGDTTTTGS